MNRYDISVWYCGQNEDGSDKWQASIEKIDGEDVKWTSRGNMHGVGGSIPEALADIGPRLQKCSDDAAAAKRKERAVSDSRV